MVLLDFDDYLGDDLAGLRGLPLGLSDSSRHQYKRVVNLITESSGLTAFDLCDHSLSLQPRFRMAPRVA